MDRKPSSRNSIGMLEMKTPEFSLRVLFQGLDRFAAVGATNGTVCDTNVHEIDSRPNQLNDNFQNKTKSAWPFHVVRVLDHIGNYK